MGDTLPQPEGQRRLHSFGAVVDEPSVTKWSVVAPLELLDCVIRVKEKAAFVLDHLCIRGLRPVEGNLEVIHSQFIVCRQSFLQIS